MPSRPTSVEEVNGAIRDAAAGNALNGILGWYDEPLVSADFNHDSHSSMFAVNETKVIDGNFVRVMTWYDNEWGFSCRMADTAVAMAKAGGVAGYQDRQGTERASGGAPFFVPGRARAQGRYAGQIF